MKFDDLGGQKRDRDKYRKTRVFARENCVPFRRFSGALQVDNLGDGKNRYFGGDSVFR